MVAVMIKENDFPSDVALQPAGRLDFGNEKSFREKSTGLLTETNDRCVAHGVCGANSFAGQDCLEHQAQRHAPGTADEVIPEIGNIEHRKAVAQQIERENKCLHRDRRPEHRRAPNALEKKTPPKKCPAPRRKKSSR